jgi:hypothetical protein
MTPIYTVGDGTRTQIAMRADGVWFKREKWRRVWGKWIRCTGRPYEFRAYLAKHAGNARLPDDAV